MFDFFQQYDVSYLQQRLSDPKVIIGLLIMLISFILLLSAKKIIHSENKCARFRVCMYMGVLLGCIIAIW